MDYHLIKPDEIVLLANVCLLLAGRKFGSNFTFSLTTIKFTLILAKLEENVDHVPKISELNAHVHNRYMAKEYKQWEVEVLRQFSWYIQIPTAAHYIHYYLQAVVTADEVSRHSDSLRTTFYRIHDLVLEYLDQVIYSEYLIILKEMLQLQFFQISIICRILNRLYWRRA